MTLPARDTFQFDRSKLQAMLDAVSRAGRTIDEQRRRLLEADQTIARLEGEKRALEANLRGLAERATSPMAIATTDRSDPLSDEAVAAMVRDVDGSFGRFDARH